MGKILRHIIPFIGVAVLAISAILPACNTVGCLENQSSVPLAGFYSSTTGGKISVDSIWVYGIGAPGDSMLNTSLRASTVYLPFRAEQPSTSFAIRYLQSDLNFPALIDTIKFSYDSEPRFVSEECGAMFFYHITGISYTTHLIDSVAVIDSLINNFDTERIKIFYRTAEPNV
ncbi:MAG: hypothetical protein J1E38_06920 [Paramuribaculum sp.]|nr:hypothetical protein [Paramuribaculum sp.]